MAPSTASVVQEDGTTEEVEIDDVEEGDIVLVKTGGAIPVDGRVIDGKGYADEAAVTGESRQVVKISGDNVFSGTILADGYVTIEATKVGDDTTFAKIIELVKKHKIPNHMRKNSLINFLSIILQPFYLLRCLLV